MTQWFKLPLAKLTSHVGVPVSGTGVSISQTDVLIQVPSTLLLTHSGAGDDGSSGWLLVDVLASSWSGCGYRKQLERKPAGR